MHDFEKALLKPNIEPMDANTQRIRRNLIVTSVIAYFFSLGSTGIDSTSSFAGIKFEGLDTKSIQLLILIALFNFIIHFIWASWDHLKENSIRLTGVAIPMIKATTSFSSTHTLEANTNDARQTTIHSWWKSQMNLIDNYKGLLLSIENNVKKDEYTPAINSIKNRIDDLEHKSSYIEEALQRYEHGFWKYQKSQTLRWILLDFGVPFIAGAISIYLMVKEIYPMISNSAHNKTFKLNKYSWLCSATHDTPQFMSD